MRVVTIRFRHALAALTAAALLASVPASIGAAPQSKKKTGPETFNGKARVATGTAVGDVTFTVQIDQYTPEKDLKAMEQALQSGGSEAFVQALRKAPVAGHFKAGEKTFTIRWARQRETPKGRVISIVTDAPVYFVGAGLPDAKPRAGFDVAVGLLNMDSSGVGEGTMALAAKVKPAADNGVEIQDYATEPVKLVSIMKVIS